MNNLIFIVFIFASATTLAQSDSSTQPVSSLRQGAKDLVIASLKKGTTQVSGVSLEDLAKQLDKPTITDDEGSGVVARAGTRADAHYYNEGEVQLNVSEISKKPPEQRDPLVLHELLGASKKYDRDYGLTLQILYSGRKSDPKNSVTDEYIKEQSKKNLESLSGGSGTSVGGGGDSLALIAKTMVLDHLNEMTSHGQDSYQGIPLLKFAEIVFDCPFEFYSGAYVVFADVFKRTSYRKTNDSAVDTLSAPWAAIRIRRDWFLSQASTRAEQVDLMMQALATQAQLNVRLCDINRLNLSTYSFLEDSHY